MKRPSRLALASAAGIAVLIAGGCDSRARERAGGPPGPVPVKAETVRKKDVPVELKTFGAVEASSVFEAKAQVGGRLVQVAFKEGDFVKEGDLLFTIDPRPYRAALDQAEANLARDQAELRNAEVEVRRLKALLAENYVSRDDHDKAVTAAEALAATVKADEAAVASARIQLEHCAIRSPIDGRTGKLMVHQGNLVKANADTPMLVVTRVRPIYVTFSLPEKDLPDVRRSLDEGPMEVGAAVPALPDRPAKGELTFFANQVDAATGTFQVRATFENQDLTLWPGQYVDVRVQLTVQRGATVVSSQAVQLGQQGPYVYVVRPDRTTEVRPVDAGLQTVRETVILRGLTPGETVVTEGQVRLLPGAKVEVTAAEGGQGVARQ